MVNSHIFMLMVLSGNLGIQVGLLFSKVSKINLAIAHHTAPVPVSYTIISNGSRHNVLFLKECSPALKVG